jgi:hypothetical protein
LAGGQQRPGGVSGPHPEGADELRVAPNRPGGRNTVRLQLLPIACWRLEDLRFDFDSSFVRPEAAAEMSDLASLRQAHAGAPASIFGHADPTGDDDYNKTLSGRRAKAVYALLVRDVAAWEQLYSNKFGGDDWGARSIQMMVRAVGFDPGVIDGRIGGHTKAAVKDYQASKGDLAVDGDAGPKTRKALFADYMDTICRDASGQPFQLDPAADFLAYGADPDLRGDVQGCGEFNPVLVFSRDEDQRFSKSDSKVERNAENLPNRRVLIFLFPPGAKIKLGNWPCPAASDGPSQCTSHFWPNGTSRRSPGDTRRLYGQTRDTMACRFYDRMARRSPCEVSRKAIRLRLLDSENDFIPHAPYRLTLGNGEVREGQADAQGWVVEQNVETPEQASVEWGYPPENGISDDERRKRWGRGGPFDYALDVILRTEDGSSDEDRALVHLNNLGYPPERTLAENLLRFQREYQVWPADGELNDDTKKALGMADDEGLSREEFIRRWSGQSP